ncbi:ras and EF-hand domain-containing protein -like, partial [Brachionus plicatilis]
MNWEIEEINYQKDEEEYVSNEQKNCDHESERYASIGLSIQSQEKISEFHQLLDDERSEKIRLFEEIICLVLRDIQNYKNEADRMEMVYINEKDQNKETIKNMIEEAEQQLNTMIEKTKLEEKKKYLKIIENLKLEYCQEIASLQENLIKTHEAEKKLRQFKKDENTQLKELKIQIENLSSENIDLKTQLRQSHSEISVLRSEIAELTNICSEKNFENFVSNEALMELCRLKQEITALHNANQKLNDTNDVLKSMIQKQKEIENERINSIQSSQREKVTYRTGFSNLKHNSTLSTSFYDEEIDSGYTASNNELSDFQNDTFFPNSLSSNFKFDYHSTPLGENLDQQNFIKNLAESENKTSTLKFENVNNNEKINNYEIQSENKSPNLDPERVFKVVFAGDS